MMGDHLLRGVVTVVMIKYNSKDKRPSLLDRYFGDIYEGGLMLQVSLFTVCEDCAKKLTQSTGQLEIVENVILVLHSAKTTVLHPRLVENNLERLVNNVDDARNTGEMAE